MRHEQKSVQDFASDDDRVGVTIEQATGHEPVITVAIKGKTFSDLTPAELSQLSEVVTAADLALKPRPVVTGQIG